MPKYIIEREIPDAGNLTTQDLQGISQKSCNILKNMGPQIQWVESFVTQDKVYCTYIAPNEEEIRKKIKEDLWINVVLPATEDLEIKPSSQKTRFLVNPTGKFVVGGPQGDAGLTGRKIIVDTYGGYARHGGGAFSGKDPTKVDRSAAYAARYVAKSIVKAKLAKKAEVQLSYAIGVAKPISILVETFGTSVISQDNLKELIKNNFDLRPAAIIKEFDLRNLPKKMGGEFFRKTASYGHFGRNDLNLPWERVEEKSAQLVEASKILL